MKNVFPKAPGDVLKCPQPKDILFTGGKKPANIHIYGAGIK